MATTNNNICDDWNENGDATDVESEWTLPNSRRHRRLTKQTSSEAHAMLARIVLKTVINEEEDDEHQSFYFILKKALEQESFLCHERDLEDDHQLSREELLEKIRKKKAVIERLRSQAWPMRRKRRTLTLAQKYLQRHEATVSKFHLIQEEFNRKCKKFERWLINLSIYLIPWEAKIKTIESHFGSVVSSYFTFLRWLIWVNMMITMLTITFIVIPECLADTFPDQERLNHSDTMKRKEMEEEDRESADYLQTVWDYKGYLSFSPLFYGYYSNKDYILAKFKYQLPLAYFLVNIFTLGYSFFAILRKMASNARLSKLTGSKTEQYPFAWKIFTGWDYSIGNSETAANTVMANANKLREAIVEHKTKQKEKFAWIRVMMRILANVLILCMIAGSTYAIFAVVERSKLNFNPTALEQNEVAIVVSFITLIFPNFFELISKALEGFHPRTALRVHLGRILALYLLNFYTLIIALLTKINALRAEQEALLLNASASASIVPSTITDHPNPNLLQETTQPLTLDRFIRQAPPEFQLDTAGPHFQQLSSLLLAILTTVSTTGMNFTSANKSIFPIHHKIRHQFLPRLDRYKRTELPATPSPNFYGPMLQAVLHADFTDEVGVKTVGDSTSQITASQISQRERSLQRLCWETWVGQEIAKLITMDLAMTIVSVLLVDCFRGVWVRSCHRWWCWNLETQFPEYGEFKVAENVLHVINNQGMIWLGLFFSPLLPAMNTLKLVVVMYVRGWAVMTCNVPAAQVFRASRSSNFYLLLLLLMLFLCTLPVGFLIASYRPSTTCGPFSSMERFYFIITNRLESQVPREIYKYVNMIASPGIIIPVLLMLGLIIYFLISLVRGLREANQDLQKQLIHERTEEKRKVYRLAGGGKPSERDHLRRLSLGLPEVKKVNTNYLPSMEQKRREAWRLRLTLDDEYGEMEGSFSGRRTPPSQTNSPSAKKKRSVRQMLTPVMATEFPPDRGNHQKKTRRSTVSFDIYDEEENRENLIKRWKLDSRKAKVPPLASMDDDALSKISSPLSLAESQYDQEGSENENLLRSVSPPPAYHLVWRESLKKYAPPAAPSVENGAAPTGSLSPPRKWTPITNVSPATSASSNSSPATRKHSAVSFKSTLSTSDQPSVVLASSDNKNRRHWKTSSFPKASSTTGTTTGTRVSPALSIRQNQCRLIAATTSCHLRSNIEDALEELDQSRQLLQPLYKKPRQPQSNQRKFQKSVSSAFLQWSPISGTDQPQPKPQPKPQPSPTIRKSSLQAAQRKSTVGSTRAPPTLAISAASPTGPQETPQVGYTVRRRPLAQARSTNGGRAVVAKVGQASGTASGSLSPKPQTQHIRPCQAGQTKPRSAVSPAHGPVSRQRTGSPQGQHVRFSTTRPTPAPRGKVTFAPGQAVKATHP